MVLSNMKYMAYLCMAGWLFMNVCVFNLTKFLFVSHKFHYPVLLTTLHMAAVFVSQGFTLRFTPIGVAHGTGNERLRLPEKLTRKVFLLSLLFCVSITLGNVALDYLTLSFFKVLFASTPLATVFMSYVLFEEKQDAFIYYALIPLTLGGVLCTVGELNLSLIGFLTAILAAILRGTKSLLQGYLLNQEKIDSVLLLFHMAMRSLLVMIPAALLFEHSALTDPNLRNNLSLWVTVLLSCASAVGYNVMTFMVTFYTSAMTLQVLGNISIALNILVAVALFQDQLSFLSVLGIVCTMLGVLAYQQAGSVAGFLRNRAAKSIGSF